MILDLIAVFGIQIIFSEQIYSDCNVEKKERFHLNGCLRRNEIYLSYYSTDINRTLYHEIGHIIFNNDDTYHELIEPLPDLMTHRDHDLNEKGADYFAYYSLKPKEFSVKHPSLYIYIRDIINNI